MGNERLRSLDEHGHRQRIIPADAHGFWRRHRDWTQAVLIIIFLVLPWTRINGQQTLKLDVAAREFSIFGTTFFSHDAPLLFFIFAFLTLGLAFITAVWGRVWCGWGCPQTVFIDGVYRRIEKWVEGSHLEQRKLAREDLSFRKLRLLTTKWFLFTAVSAFIAHSFLAYFVGARELVAMMGTSPSDHWVYFILVLSMTALLLFDFGWFREQFCIIMCPYGRFQSVLMDERSLTVFYDEKRGEPRKGISVAWTPTSGGDCVNCLRCVHVCPTGIDIRDGLQMECIGCTACIDACDEIMDKVKKPRGLIRYSSLKTSHVSILRPRNIFYMVLLAVCTVGFVASLNFRSPLQITVLRGQDTPYSQTKNQKNEVIYTNHFRIHLKNQTADAKSFQVDLPQHPLLTLTLAQNPVRLAPYADLTIHVFVQILPDKEVPRSWKLIFHNSDDVTDFYETELKLVVPDGF